MLHIGKIEYNPVFKNLTSTPKDQHGINRVKSIAMPKLNCVWGTENYNNIFTFLHDTSNFKPREVRMI